MRRGEGRGMDRMGEGSRVNRGGKGRRGIKLDFKREEREGECIGERT